MEFLAISSISILKQGVIFVQCSIQIDVVLELPSAMLLIFVLHDSRLHYVIGIGLSQKLFSDLFKLLVPSGYNDFVSVLELGILTEQNATMI